MLAAEQSSGLNQKVLMNTVIWRLTMRNPCAPEKFSHLLVDDATHRAQGDATPAQPPHSLRSDLSQIVTRRHTMNCDNALARCCDRGVRA